MEQRRWLLLPLALLPAISLSECFELTSPQNVVGTVGHDTTLPCTISATKPLENLKVQWIKVTDGHTEDIYTYGQFGGKAMQKYRGRTSVPGDGFATGDMSLTLKNVQPADEGMYRCIVISRDWSADTATKLSIAGTGEVFIEIQVPQGQGLELGCRSHGWFPKPTVQWVTENGQGLSADTESHQDSEKLFSVWSQVTVTGEQVGKVTCQILNPLVQVEKTTVLLSGAAFLEVSPWLPAFSAVLLLLLATLAAVTILLFRGRNKLFAWFPRRRKGEKPSHKGTTEDANNMEDLDSMLQKVDQQRSPQIQTLQEAFQNMNDSTQCDLKIAIANMTNELGMTLKVNTMEALNSMLQKVDQQCSPKIQTLQEAFQNMIDSRLRDIMIAIADVKYSTQRDLKIAIADVKDSTQRDLKIAIADLKNELVYSKMQRYKEFVTLDADTAHPRLEISGDGRTVKDTGVIRQVPSNEKRFDSHLIVLAKEGYTSGKHYWEVNVGPRKSWALGIAHESVTRQGPLTLSPPNGFWVIRLADGQHYWIYTDRWTRLSVSGHLHKIGIFLNIRAKQVTFYDLSKGAALYTYSIADGSSQEGEFIPFFSIGHDTAEPDTEPLAVV